MDLNLDFKQTEVIGWKQLPKLEGEKDNTPLPNAKELLKESKQKKIKEFYPIYSDSPHAWQADLMKIPYARATANHEQRLHHF